MERALHILNGDQALKLWEKCSFPGEALVWRETYLEGPLPDTEDLHTFRSARAAFLATFKETEGIGVDRLYSHLQRMDDTLLERSGKGDLMLWFDGCLFDQTLLMRILYLLNSQKNKGNVFLYCSDNNCLTLDDFCQGKRDRLCLTAEELRAAARGWLLYQRRDGAGLKQLACQQILDRLPRLQEALCRSAEEFPDGQGLTRTQRRILQLVGAGKSSFKEIFTGLDAFEKYPLLGDTACQRLLDHLTERRLLTCTAGRYTLTEK